MSFPQQFLEQFVHHRQLTTAFNAVLIKLLLVFWPDVTKQIGVQTYLPWNHLIPIPFLTIPINAPIFEVIFVQLEL